MPRKKRSTNKRVANRVAISKKTRFEIFKRDSFTCQYCNRRPPDTTLVIDHVVPVADGGSNEIINLVTSCFDCNAGKSCRPLTGITLSPDAELERLRLDQEILEAKQYFESRKQLNELNRQIITSIQDHYKTLLPYRIRPTLPDFQVKIWLSKYTPTEILKSIEIASTYASNGREFPGTSIFAYISGILKRRASGTAGGENAKE